MAGRKYWYSLNACHLTQRAISGIKNAAQQRFLSLFLRSEREIFRYVAALVPNVADAEDIVQQTALALWEKFDAYDPSQPFTPWACRFALNKTKQWIERRQRWQALLEGGLAEELAQRREELRPEIETRLKHLEGCLSKLARRAALALSRAITIAATALRNSRSIRAERSRRLTKRFSGFARRFSSAWRTQRKESRDEARVSFA